MSFCFFAPSALAYTTSSIKHQVESGISVNELFCDDGRVLAVKQFDDSPACVRLDTFSKLIDRGWANPIENYSDSIKQEILSSLRGGPKMLNNLEKDFVISEMLKDKMIYDMLDRSTYQTNCCSYSIYVDSHSYPTLVMTFHVNEKNMIVTAEYDLQKETVSSIDTHPVQTEDLASIFKTPESDSGLFTTMKPNSVEFFYYPNTGSDQSDKYRLFMLIRLPEWMGGYVNDASAFRAYSAKSIDDPCIIKYWGDPGRQRIENPCQGGMYRVVDGAMTLGAIYRSTPMTALPQLDLSMDVGGTLYVEPPKWTKDENGVIGYGREISYEEYHDGSEFLLELFSKSYPEYPNIPIKFAGYDLSEISPDKHEVIVSYVNFPDNSDDIRMTILKSPVGFGHLNLATPNTEFWQIGDGNVIKVGGRALDAESSVPARYRDYEVQFSKDNSIFRIEGKDIEFIKKEIVKNYFPEYEYDDLFLISKN